MKGKLTILFLIVSSGLMAQEAPAGTAFGLEECIDYALKNSVDIRNARIGEQIAEARVKETIGIGLPQVTGSVNVQQSPTQPRFFGEYTGPEQDFFGLSQRNPNIQVGDVGAAENFFQLKGSGDANLRVNQLIFNGSYFVGLQASNAFKDLSVKEYRQTEEEVVLKVSKAYYNLLITREQLLQLEANIGRIDSLYRNTSAMHQNGFAEKIDVDRIKVNLNNLKVDRDNLLSLNDISIKLLKFQMNYPLDEELVINDSIGGEMLQGAIPDLGEDWGYSERPDYQVLQANYQLQKLNIKNKYAEAIPVISGFVSMGYSTQSPNFGGLFQTNADFQDMNGVGPDKWYGYSTLGLTLSWNPFTGLQRTFQIQQEKLKLLQMENSFDAMEQSIDLNIEQSRKNLETALKRLSVQEENKELAAEIYRVAQIKYEQGVGSNLEVIDADTSLKDAQTNYYSALYDAIIAQLEMKKALGTLTNK